MTTDSRRRATSYNSFQVFQGNFDKGLFWSFKYWIPKETTTAAAATTTTKGTREVDMLLCKMSFRKNTKVGLVQWRNQLVSNAPVHARRRRWGGWGGGTEKSKPWDSEVVAAAEAAGARLIIWTLSPPTSPSLPPSCLIVDLFYQTAVAALSIELVNDRTHIYTTHSAGHLARMSASMAH